MKTEEYLDNWFLNLDLKCNTIASNNSILSFYFIGYGVGLIFYFLPDRLGRKRSLVYLSLMNIVAAYLTVFGQSVL